MLGLGDHVQDECGQRSLDLLSGDGPKEVDGVVLVKQGECLPGGAVGGELVLHRADLAQQLLDVSRQRDVGRCEGGVGSGRGVGGRGEAVHGRAAAEKAVVMSVKERGRQKERFSGGNLNRWGFIY